MIKFLPLLFLFTQQAFSQAIAERTVDSTGNITVVTTIDTIAEQHQSCYIDGMICTFENQYYYGFDLFFEPPQDFYLTEKDKVLVRYGDGEVQELAVFTQGELINGNQLCGIKALISEDELRKMTKYRVISISLLTPKFKHTIRIDPEHTKKLFDLSYYMLHLNVSNPDDYKWSELMKMKFPEN